MQEKNYWQQKPLTQMNDKEWESLCDGCAKCCIFKFEEDETGHILQTDVVCKLLDLTNCHCTQYKQRKQLVPDCISITPENILHLKWMPETCSYRLLALGKNLPKWHPLITGDQKSAQHAGKTVQGDVVSETEVDDLESRIIGWFDPKD
ncbi:MAG: YcgN family cysteine cluster protein [Gammaproteobacteria bacterium]|nr:YcgN family cysteine cluster protein [Gammaproteobacteria bacterium]